MIRKKKATTTNGLNKTKKKCSHISWEKKAFFLKKKKNDTAQFLTN